MGLINFNKPAKVRTTAEHNKRFMSDSGVDGTYVPNMSDEAMKTWRGKHIKGEHERVEVRKTLGGVQLVVVVYKDIKFTHWSVSQSEWYKNHNNVRLSMNGKLDITFAEYDELVEVVKEAKEILGV